ncbi:MAG: FecR domain-containing protein [Candidatus Omnitrophica bacterium]|nr:FecR domain-containing protein [Candidatus Omnitrophota bacterium]
MKIKLLLIAAILFSSSAFAQEVGRVTYVEGRVDMLKAGAKEAVMIKADEPVSVGDFIRTKSDSKAEIVFNDESVVRVAQNSRLQVKDYQLSGDKRKTATILLERGKARTTIAKMPGGTPFIILTPNAQGTIKGSDIFSFYQAGNSGMLVSEGMLSVFNIARPDEIVSVRPGEAVLIPLQESPKGPRAFLEMEKRMEEVETNIPPALSRRKSMAVIMGTMIKFSGEVKIISKGKSLAHPARPNERLEAGDRIQTGKNGVAEIVFDNGNAMYLKSNTDITITKLINDPETQEYENLFDAKVGKIKARIERLSGKSKFEVRTPTAVCGARGTIMYLGVSETGETESFFEGGTGFVTSLGNNQTEFVGAGEKAGVSVDGEVSDSAPVSESEQMSFDEGFDPGTGTEGQGVGSADGYLYGSGNNTDSEGGIGTEGEADQAEGAAMDATLTEGDPAVGEVFIDIPVTEAGTVEEPTSEDPVTPTPTHDVLVGNTYTSQVVATDPVLTQNGSLYDYKLDVTPVSIWAETSASATVTAGIVPDTSATYHIWTVDAGNFYSYNSSTGTYTTSDGGAYYGLSGGIQVNISGTNKIENMFIALYIDPSGNAGTFTGYFTGTNQEFFSLTGTVDATMKMSTFDLLPEDLYSNISEDGRFSGIGYNDFGSSGGEYVKVNLEDGKAMNIDTPTEMGKDWGIWGARIAGSYKGDLTPALASNIQISGLTESDIPVTRTDGAWLGWFNISEWNANKVGGPMDGIYLALQSGGVLETKGIGRQFLAENGVTYRIR